MNLNSVSFLSEVQYVDRAHAYRCAATQISSTNTRRRRNLKDGEVIPTWNRPDTTNIAITTPI